MNKIIKLAMAHGEKAFLAIVAIFCLWSIMGNLFKDNNKLIMVDGTYKDVDNSLIDSAIKRMESHLNNPKPALPVPSLQQVSKMVDEAFGQKDRKVKDVDYDWFAYLQPPLPVILGKVEKEPPEDKDNPGFPDKYISRNGAPTNVKMTAGGKSILITCEDFEEPNYVKKDSVKIYLYRKEIGEAKENISPEAISEFQKTPREEVVNVTITTPEATLAGAGDLAGRPVATAETRQPIAATWFDADEEDDEVDKRIDDNKDPRDNPSLYKEFMTIRKANKQRARADMKNICDFTSVVITKWELLTPDGMPVLSAELEDDEILKVFKTGRLPDTITKPEVKPEGDEETPKEEEAPAVKPGDWDDDPEEEPEETEDIARTRTDDEEDITYNPDNPVHEPRKYVFLDNTATPNKLYRYRLVVEFKAELPPKKVVMNKKYQGCPLRVEMGDRGRRLLGYTKSQFDEYVATEKPYSEAKSKNFKLQRITLDEKMKLSEKSVQLFIENEKKSKLAKEMHKEIYSDFVYTDLIMIPVRKRIMLVNAWIKPEPKARVKVVVVADDGMHKARTYSIDPPKFSIPVKWTSWLKRDENNKYIPVDKQPMLGMNDRLTDVYEKRILGIELTRIGSKFKSGDRTWDLETDEYLVDIRPYRVIRRRYKFNEDTEKQEEIGSPLIRTKVCVITREYNPTSERKATYRRIIAKEKPSISKKYIEKYEYIWEPEAYDRIQKKLKEMKGND